MTASKAKKPVRRVAAATTAPSRIRGLQQRGQNTRYKLMRAALDCITEVGYTGASMDVIVAKAGVSRGAQVHHFPTKQELITDSFATMLDEFIVDLRTRMESIRNRDEDPSVLFNYLWERYFSGQLFSVTMELVVQSRSNSVLREKLQPIVERFHRNMDDCWFLLCRGRNIRADKLLAALNLTLSVLRGMGFQMVLWERPEHFRGLLDEWLKILSAHLKADSR